MNAFVGTAHAQTKQESSRLGSVANWLARESLPIVVCCAFAALIVVLLPQLLSTDGWLALVGGRLIAQHGLPHHDTLTIVGHGRTWVDQQWLGQLTLYGLERLGGVRLVLAANLLLVVGAFVAAVAYARVRGGRPNTVSLVALVALLPFLVTAMNVRTQTLSYLPFVGLAALLSGRTKLSPLRVVLILVLLALWSNVHGSVLLAAPLVALRGALDLRQSREQGKTDWAAVALLVGPWLCLFASPYAIQLPSYYATTAFNPAFAKYLSQWAPTTFSPISLPLLVLLFALVWLLGRTRETYSTYEQWLLAVAAVVGLAAVRNWTFAALLAVMLVPVGLDRAVRKRASSSTPRVAAPIAAIVLAATVIGAAAVLAHPESALTRDYPLAVGAATDRAAAGPYAQVYAGVTFADWLLWARPDLAGKLVLDARYELLSSAEIRRLTLFALGASVDTPLGQPTVYVLDPATDAHAIAALRPHAHVLYDTHDAFVADVVKRR